MSETATTATPPSTSPRIHPWMHWQDVVDAANVIGLEPAMLIIDIERGTFPRHHHYYTNRLTPKRVMRVPVWAREAVETALAQRTTPAHP